MPTLTDVTVKEIGHPIADNIVQVLNARGFYRIKVEDPIIGPVITGFPLKIPPQIPIKKIFPLEEDIAMACDVESVTIQRIGNRVIVFVPNKDKKIVQFLDSIYWFLKDEKVKEMQLPILLGQDYVGENSAIDLAIQPHILIAGSTGSGKSVFESSVIAALSTAKSPQQMHLYLVDTKRLDLTLFEDLPHVKEVVRTIKEWYMIANTLYGEVQRRQLRLEKFGCRNIADYNEKLDEKMPYIVVVIDELADLMEKDNAQRMEDIKNEEFHEDAKVMDAIKRIVQVSRASGVHFIACTQRTAVTVVSNDVKVNFPTRIALKCPTRQDSTTIIGQGGAENLLGNGDMLIQHADSEVIQRYHGPFVRMEDITAVTSQRERLLEQIGA